MQDNEIHNNIVHCDDDFEEYWKANLSFRLRNSIDVTNKEIECLKRFFKDTWDRSKEIANNNWN